MEIKCGQIEMEFAKLECDWFGLLEKDWLLFLLYQQINVWIVTTNILKSLELQFVYNRCEKWHWIGIVSGDDCFLISSLMRNFGELT